MDIDSNSVLLKDEPEDLNHVEHTIHENSYSNHVSELKNGRTSPKSPTDESHVVNNKHVIKNNHKKEINMWSRNVNLRQMVVKEVRKPGKSE